MSDYSSLIAKQKQQLEEQLAKLNGSNLSALEEKKAKLLKEVEAIDAEIASKLKELGLATSSEKPGSKTKTQGIQVSFNRLMELFKEHGTNELNLRALKLDTKQIKKLVDEHPEKLELGGKGAWPLVKWKSR
ncbi:MAG: hypothetical protein QM796_13170 [Chthoniobacteraceae bacterium]